MKTAAKPRALAGYRFRRRADMPDLALMEILTPEGGVVPICMTKCMIEQLERSCAKMAARLKDTPEVA